MHRRHLELPSVRAKVLRHLATRVFAARGPAQGGGAADDLHKLRTTQQPHAASMWPQRELLLLRLADGTYQTDQRTKLVFGEACEHKLLQ